jgi:hypothetical protein
VRTPVLAGAGGRTLTLVLLLGRMVATERSTGGVVAVVFGVVPGRGQSAKTPLTPHG